MPSAPSLEPQVKGRLAEQEAAIIKAIQAGESTWRTTISLEAELALAAVRAADREKREFSNLVAVVLADFTHAHGPLPPEQSERIAKLAECLATDSKLGAELDRLLAQSRRRVRVASAA